MTNRTCRFVILDGHHQPLFYRMTIIIIITINIYIATDYRRVSNLVDCCHKKFTHITLLSVYSRTFFIEKYCLVYAILLKKKIPIILQNRYVIFYYNMMYSVRLDPIKNTINNTKILFLYILNSFNIFNIITSYIYYMRNYVKISYNKFNFQHDTFYNH